jgi:hypothetical protein
MYTWTPLSNYLKALPAGPATLTFRFIEQLIGKPLPRSAFVHKAAWWANNGTRHFHAQAWLEAGCRVTQVDLRTRTVTFEKA